MQLWLQSFVQMCRSNGYHINPTQQYVIPVWSLISRLLHMLRMYLHKACQHTWAVDLMHRVGSSTRLSVLIYSWMCNCKVSLQCQLLGCFLNVYCPHKIELFLRVRNRAVLLYSVDILDEVQLILQDIIGILHRLFHQQSTRDIIINGTKSIFMSFQIPNAKIQACVFIQYMLSIQTLIYTKQHDQASVIKHFYSNVDQLKTDLQFTSNIHQQNGMCFKSSEQKHRYYSIIDKKFPSNSKMKNYNTFKSTEQDKQSAQYKRSINSKYQSKQSSFVGVDKPKLKRKPIFKDSVDQRMRNLVQNNQKYKRQALTQHKIPPNNNQNHILISQTISKYQCNDKLQHIDDSQDSINIGFINSFREEIDEILNATGKISPIQNSVVRNQRNTWNVLD